MAEAFGIVAGGVGVAAAFTACVDCFEYIQFGRHFGRDYQTNLLSLDFARLRLTRWGQAVNIFEDPNLGRPDATSDEIQTVKQSLLQILALFQFIRLYRRPLNSPQDVFRLGCSSSAGRTSSWFCGTADASSRLGIPILGSAAWWLCHSLHISSYRSHHSCDACLLEIVHEAVWTRYVPQSVAIRAQTNIHTGLLLTTHPHKHTMPSYLWPW